jgi:uncharacterized iron-regulated membrane protein
LTDVDQEIADVFGLLGLLFVFVLGYFSALLPQAEELLQRRAPDVQEDRRALWARLRGYRRLTNGMVVMIVLVLGVLFPISRRSLETFSLAEGFPTLRAGLLLIDAFLVVMLIAGIWLWLRMSKRIDQVADLGV